MSEYIADPRPAYAAATAWAQSLLENLTEAQLDAPTPCGDLDVRAMARHLHATLLQARAIAETGSAEGQPVSVEEFDAPTFAARRSAALAAWESAPLDRAVTVPWGTAPAASALGMYVNEALVHGWDIAVGTGQESECPDGAAPEVALSYAREQIPAELRSVPGFPFGPVVAPRAEAGPTERLANWNGRIPSGRAAEDVVSH